ncbi:hypothetical protein BJ085DRAFT_37007 [Dimargaris cristalligena]|uniref:Uncharacterized protein n=1 Tax=Dimargaris cristalligena TaxID=215637 RepID=A0A4Q0A2E6_9FUNG|nr:hypothetical protein BJ085DRAFT_37007 [Dimargaris cristalligena]|eukprot:RKP40283.1 hypothetical protein BJ085DRAFT_37007 [Dimargaris cristalligena]
MALPADAGCVHLARRNGSDKRDPQTPITTKILSYIMVSPPTNPAASSETPSSITTPTVTAEAIITPTPTPVCALLGPEFKVYSVRFSGAIDFTESRVEIATYTDTLGKAYLRYYISNTDIDGLQLINLALVHALPASPTCTRLVRRDSSNKCGPEAPATVTATATTATIPVDTASSVTPTDPTTPSVTKESTTDTPTPTPTGPAICDPNGPDFKTYVVRLTGIHNYGEFESEEGEYKELVAATFDCFLITGDDSYAMTLTYRPRPRDADIMKSWPQTASVIEA